MLKEIDQEILKHCKYYCKSTNIKIVFSPFKIRDLFSDKESMYKHLRSFVVYRFTCPDCSITCIGETTSHLRKWIKEHLETTSKSNIFKHLNTNRDYIECCDKECFEIIDFVTSCYGLKLKESLISHGKKNC